MASKFLPLTFSSRFYIMEDVSKEPFMNNLREIDIRTIQGFRIGSAEYEESATGVTVIVADHGALCSVDVRGGGPASREEYVIDPLTAPTPVNAVILSGGSAFGLNTADGAMRYFEERNIGFPTMFGRVPIIPASCLFDLALVTGKVRPDADLAYHACVNAETYSFLEGSHGAGCGATVGKLLGPDYCMKSGQAVYALQAGNIQVGAFVALNAVGDIHDYHTGKKIAGIRDRKSGEWISAEEVLCGTTSSAHSSRENTTLGAIITNVSLTKAELRKVAAMAHNGYARTIYPVHTMYDGDTIYALTNGETKGDINIVGTMAAIAMAEAIMKAARPAGNSYGLPKAE